MAGAFLLWEIVELKKKPW